MTNTDLELPPRASRVGWRSWTPALPTRPGGTTVSSSSALASWTGWLLAAMAGTVLLYGIDIVLQPVTPAFSEVFQKFAGSAVFFGAAALCLLKGRRSLEERSVWWLFALAMLLWGAGSVYYSLALWDREVVPYPSLADGLWLAFYVPLYLALYMLLRKRAGLAARAVWLDAVVAGLGVGGAGAALVFHTVLEHSEGPMIGVATNLAYPIADLGVLALVVAAITVVGWKGAGLWRLVGCAFALFAVADSIYLFQVAEGTYAVGGIADLGWPIAALLVGLAAWRPEARALTVRSKSIAVMPAGFAAIALALLVIDHFFATNPLALALATASILVVLVRLYLTVRENASLLARSRREAATDSLTGLGNRRQLSSDLLAEFADLDSARPLTLTLFDLDGFKVYNDTFGHVAGDQLLGRLGARLSAVVEGHGVAYRTGGDEFCALWNRSESGGSPTIIEKAVAALSERGEGFAIGCSYGSVVLPNEATDPIEAERIADARMYARKGSARTSAGRQSFDVLLRTLTERNSDLVVHLGGLAEMACATAKRLGVHAEDMEAVRQTALLHDVGKVAIPDEILRKPESLDHSEWEFMKRHPLIGERIISAAPALTVVARSVRSTHERYEGGGYPDGLVGDEIPLIARIVAVCDAYDAMRTKRPYQHARSRSAAIAELRRCSGKQFDPAVVDSFVDALDASPAQEWPARAYAHAT